ncbi:MAG TPA: hypothetical protein VFV25_02950 [Methylibium sp.]
MNRHALSVRRRLLLGFGLQIVLLTALAAGTVWQLRSMGLQIERIVEGHDRRSDLAHRLNAAQLDWREQLRALLTVSDPEDQKAQCAELIAAQRRHVQGRAEELQTAMGGFHLGGAVLATSGLPPPPSC